MEDPIVLIAGGSDKSLMFAELGKRIHAIGSQMRLIILLPGEGTARLRSTLPNGLIREATSMKEAVEIAAAEAQAGDAVLLSPACASFGLFDNEFHRGDLFNQSVANL